MYEAYRVRRQFQFTGWIFSPPECICACGDHVNQMDVRGIPELRPGPVPDCKRQAGESCRCRETSCRCACGILKWQYGGDVWLVMAGHFNKPHILARRFATYDAALPSGDDLVKEPAFARLLQPPRELVAGRRK